MNEHKSATEEVLEINYKQRERFGDFVFFVCITWGFCAILLAFIMMVKLL